MHYWGVVRTVRASRHRGAGVRGVALVAVLWVLTLLAVVAAGVTVGARTELALARNLDASARAEALADAGVARAALALLERRRARGERPRGIDEIEDEGAAGPGDLADLLEALPLDQGAWPVDGTPVALAFDDALLAVTIEDEEGKIDLNRAGDELLRGLFVSVGVAEDEAHALADAIGDFADEDELVRASGAEEADYRAAGLDWGPKNARFQTPEELLMVVGITPELYAAVRPAITVWSGRRGIDPRVAPAHALAALPGANDVQIEQLLADRAAGIERPAGLLGVDEFTSRSRGRVFTVRSQARTADGATFVREAVVRIVGRPERPYDVMWWGQGAPRQQLTPGAFDDE